MGAQVTTTTLGNRHVTNGNQIALAGSRLWFLCQTNANGLDLYYSDDGSTFTKSEDLEAAGNWVGEIAAEQNGGTWELHGVYASQTDNSSSELKHFRITSNAASGTPGAATTISISGAVAALRGYLWPRLALSPTASNPRVWVTAAKRVTDGSEFRVEAFYGNMGSTPSWTNLSTNLGASGYSLISTFGDVTFWYDGAGSTNPRVMLVASNGDLNPQGLTSRVITNPDAATPTLPGGTNFGQLTAGGFHNDYQFGPLMTMQGLAQNGVRLARMDNTAGNFDYYKWTTAGGWAQPAGYADHIIGKPTLSQDGTQWWAIYPQTYEGITAAVPTVVDLKYRSLSTADVFGTAATFGDQQGRVVAAPDRTGTTFLRGFFRTGTSSPFGLRYDSVSIASGSSASVAETSQILRITLPDNQAGHGGIDSVLRYDLTDSSIQAKLAAAGAQSADREALMEVLQTSDDRAGFRVFNGNLEAITVVAGTPATLATVAYNAGTHAYLRLRHTIAGLTWETSANGTSWSTLHEVADPIVLANVNFRLRGRNINSTTTVTHDWDDVNIQVPFGTETLRTRVLMGVGL